MEAPTVQLNDIALFVEVAKRKSFSLARALDMPRPPYPAASTSWSGPSGCA